MDILYVLKNHNEQLVYLKKKGVCLFLFIVKFIKEKDDS